MGKKIFEVYLAKEGIPNNEAYAKLDLPASLWELWDALDKVRLQIDDILYMEIEGYDAFEYLSPHLDGLDISINELNDLASLLSALDEVHFTVFRASSYSALSVLNRPSPFTHSERTLLRLAGVALATCGKSPKSS